MCQGSFPRLHDRVRFAAKNVALQICCESLRSRLHCAPIFRGTLTASVAMKADIHPEYKAITVTCSCGNTFPTRSTLGSDLQIEVCSNCHPFYTGKQKVMDTGGRVDKFRKRYAK
jgi:large subunit ribosomal protein L31